MRDAAVDVLLAVLLSHDIENEIDMPVLHGQPGAALLPDADEPVEKAEKVLVQRRVLAAQCGAVGISRQDGLKDLPVEAVLDMLEVRPELHVIDVMQRRRAVPEYRRLLIERGRSPHVPGGLFLQDTAQLFAIMWMGMLPDKVIMPAYDVELVIEMHDGPPVFRVCVVRRSQRSKVSILSVI